LSALFFLLFVLPLPAQAATRNYSLYISTASVTITASPVTGNGAATIPAWGYTDVAGGAAKVPGPVLTAREGDAVSVTVVNNDSRSHNFVVKRVTTDTSAIPTGGTKTYAFTAPAAGAYVYYDSLGNNVNREMGLYGILIVEPADGSKTAWTGGPAYTSAVSWVVSEMDEPRWNDVASSGGTVSTPVYKPNYFLMNGMNGFQAMGDPNTTIMGRVGDTALVRLVNAGQYSHSLHFHGNHYRLIDVDGVRQTSFKELDIVNVPPLGTAMVLFELNQPGVYPMHIHTAQMETGNGVYLNGVAAMIDIQP
jgi:FtsP/CotA-like multicopper oxidase with cupredoxin domain